MDIGDLTDAVLKDLRRPRTYPAVSLLVPTHRREPGNPEDRVRLRNALAEAKRRLGEDPKVSRDVRIDVEKQLDAAAAEADFRRSAEGLLILAAPGEHELWYLPRPVPQRVVIDGTYLTRNLVAARIGEEPYWALVLSDGETRLWSGGGPHGGHLEEVTGDGFPVAPAIPDQVDALPGANFANYGSRPSPYRTERERQYLRLVDGALGRVLERDPRPVYLVGLPVSLARFEEVSAHGTAVAARVERGGAASATAPELRDLLGPAFDECHERSRVDIQRRLVDARGQRRYAAGLDEVWQTVQQGRVALLAVEEGYETAARVEDGHLVVAAGPGVPGSPDGVHEDIVDELVEAALDKGSEVRFVPDGDLAEAGHIAGVLRF